MPILTKVSGAYKTVDNANNCFIKVGGAWKKCAQVYIKVGEAWKPCFQTNVSRTMDLGSLPYATWSEENWNYVPPSSWTTVTLSNVVVNSTITLAVGNARTLWRSADGDGGADEGDWVDFRMDIAMSGADYASTTDSNTTFYWSGSNYGSSLSNFGATHGIYGSFNVNFTAKSTNVSLTFKPYETIITGAKLYYTTSN